MFDLKMKARLLLGDRYIKLWIFKLLSALYLCFSLYLIFPPVFTVFYGGDTEISGKEIVFNCICVLCALFFIVFSFLLKLYYKAKLFYPIDKKCLPPSVFFSFFLTFRFIKLHFYVFLRKLFLFVVFYFPSALAFFVLVAGIFINGSMLKSVFFCLLSLGLTLLILGTAFFFSYGGKYFICDYLFYLNPRMPADEIIKTASSLLREKLISAAVFRLSLFPWKLLSLCVFSLPFSSVYSDAAKAYKAEEIYSDREYYRNFNRLFKGISLISQKKMREADTGMLPPL